MSRPATRVVPTLTEVLDDSHWQAISAPGEVAGASEALLELPDLADPVVDLSEAAVLAAPDESAVLPMGEPIDEQCAPAAAALLHHDAGLLAMTPVLDESLRRALDATLAEAGPAIVELLLPRLRQQLMPELEALLGDTVRRLLNER